MTQQMKPGTQIQINDDENIIDVIYLYELDGIVHVKVDGIETEYRSDQIYVGNLI